MSTRKRVIVLGGGVAGMSAAHELVERGFDVEVYEARQVPGGKARSIPVPDTGTDGRSDLPGEHGFRFFPGFYKHLPDTMKRIPFAGNNEGVFDNLVTTSAFMIARKGREDPVIPSQFPWTPWGIYELLKSYIQADIGISIEESAFFADKMFTYMTSCQDRRLAEYEKISWWNFTDASNKSAAYVDYYVKGLTRSLVAMQAETASTRTVGDIFVQLFQDLMTPDGKTDRVLNAPTNEAWLSPWREYLTQRGVRLVLGGEVSAIHCVEGRITEAVIVPTDEKGNRGDAYKVSGDYFVLAVPVEKAGPLLNTDALLAADPKFKNIMQLRYAWMNGMQFYFDVELPFPDGHVLYVDSPWALTSISQGPFWKKSLSNYGAGNVRGVLSVDISDWNTPGVIYGKAAKDLDSQEQIFEEVFEQLRQSLTEATYAVIDKSHLVKWFLDPDIVVPNPSGVTNLEPLLVNVINSWKYRPEATTEIPNLFLASDYVRTYTDLATMEGANEAGRRAVNAILESANSREPKCQLWPLHEWDVLAPLKAYDQIRFDLGLPHGKIL